MQKDPRTGFIFLESPPAGPALVVAPHPDDETLGVGGIIAMHRARGDRVDVLLLTNGSSGDPGRGDTRLKEFQRAVSVLGVSGWEHVGLPDGGLESAADLDSVISSRIETLKPAVLYCPSPFDQHADNATTGKACSVAARLFAEPPVLAFYEVGSPILATHIVDVTSVEKTKVLAMGSYESRSAVFDCIAAIRGRDSFRSFGTPPGCRFAEALCLEKISSPPRPPEHEDSISAIEQPGLTATDVSRLSVIVRSYKRPFLLAEALLSIASQDAGGMEVVLVNAGCDDLGPVIRRFDGVLNVKVVDPGRELSRPAALNAGIRASSREFITYLDDDDIHMPGHARRIVSALVAEPGEIVYTGALVSEAGSSSACRKMALPWNPSLLLFGNYIPLICLGHAKSVWMDAGGFDETLSRFEDWDFLLRLSRKHTFRLLPHVTAEYRLRPESRNEGAEDFEKVFQRHRAEITPADCRAAMDIMNLEIRRLGEVNERISRRTSRLEEEAAALEKTLNRQSADLRCPDEIKKTALALSREIYVKRAENMRMQKRMESALRKASSSSMSVVSHSSAGAAGPRKDLLALRMSSTSGWRRTLLAGIWVLLHQGPGIFGRKLVKYVLGRREPSPGLDGYHWWFMENYAKAYDPDRAVSDAAALESAPILSLIMPVYKPDMRLLREAVDSVLAQSYPKWELCIADDGSGIPELSAYLEGQADRDPRIRVTALPRNMGIAQATNAAFGLASGGFAGFMDQDDLLPPWALLDVARMIGRNPGADICYTDEDKVDSKGIHSEPYLKPDWSPDLLLSHNYMCHLIFYRHSLLKSVGGLRPGFDGAQDYDLVLRMTEKSDRIVHVPRICYHWRKTSGSTAVRYSNKPDAENATLKALSETMDRRGVRAEVSKGIFAGSFRVRRILENKPLVSVLIPSRDSPDLIRHCTQSIWSKTSYDNYEILVADNGSSDQDTLDYLAEMSQAGRIRVMHCPGLFNFPELNNRAAEQARGEVLILLNNDIEVVSPGWIEAMLEHGQRPEVGAVGAKLLYPDGSIQHAGVVTGLGGVAGHSHKYYPKYSRGYCGHIDLVRNYSAVTAACMMVRKSVYRKLGGMDAKALPRAFNDVDFCLRIRKEGYLIVYTPYAVLYHLESVSRGFMIEGFEIDAIKKKWGDSLLHDPYYNPNLTLDREDFSLR